MYGDHFKDFNRQFHKQTLAMSLKLKYFEAGIQTNLFKHNFLKSIPTSRYAKCKQIHHNPNFAKLDIHLRL